MSIDKTKLDDLIEKMKAEAKKAVEDPDTARRQLRAFWSIVGTAAGVLIGLGVGYLVWGL